jgi:hypothetical protein
MNGPARALSGADNLPANAEETVAGGLVHGRNMRAPPAAVKALADAAQMRPLGHRRAKSDRL